MPVNPRLAVVGAVCVLALSPTAALAHGGGRNLIESELTPSLPTDAAINHVAPGGLPWILEEGTVRVRASGRMDVRIEGLQIPRNGAADNPIASVNALLYCGGTVAADSGPQPMSVPGGDARFRVWLQVPRHCDGASVLISPTQAVGRAYIASAVAMDD